MTNLKWVTQAEYHKNFEITLTFNDGEQGIVDLKNRLYGEMFEPLLDIQVFKKFTLNEWTIEWENGADLAPEFLYDLMHKQKLEQLTYLEK